MADFYVCYVIIDYFGPKLKNRNWATAETHGASTAEEAVSIVRKRWPDHAIEIRGVYASEGEVYISKGGEVRP